MAKTSLRREVLQSFKIIHRTRCCVFKDDTEALERARVQINDTYKSHKDECDTEKIKELIKFAHDVVNELKTTVLQFKLVGPGKYQAQLRPEIFDAQQQQQQQQPKIKKKSKEQY